jgi:hypothetical protein
VDAAEDAEHGRGRRGDELPAELARRESRLAKIRAAKAALEREARERAEQAAAAARAKVAAREQRVGSAKGGVPKVPDAEATDPDPMSQRNFTDPDSRIMQDGAARKSFVQAYNAQAAVDSGAQVVVACAVTQEATDVQQLVPMLEQVVTNTGQRPAVVTADAGYFSASNVTTAAVPEADLYVPPDKSIHGRIGGPRRIQHAIAQRMREKLTSTGGREIYRQRKQIVEPVFGQIKEARGFRRFSLRGIANVRAEWALICVTHNLLKLHRVQFRLQPT